MAVSTQAPGFIFDATGGGSALTYEQLQARRKVYDAMVARQRGRAPQNIGEGLQAFGEGILAGIEGRQLRNAEAESAKTQAGIWDKLGALGHGGAGAGFGSATGAIGDGRYTVADTGNSSAEPLSTAPDDGDIYTSFLDTVRTGDPDKGLSGITNPYGLAAVAATGKHESGYSARNAFGNWSDPSESGQAGQAGGVLSWRAERLASMRDFVAKNGGDPRRPDPRLQAQFFLAEDPSLVARLNAAKSPEEAQSLMNGAWRFAGYDRPGGEAARRMATARSYVSQFAGNQPQQAPAAPVQVASLDPSAGIAAATAGQPANVPVPTPSATAREALEKAFAAQAAGGTEPYTGPALNDPNAMSSIAPAGMPGSTPQTEAAIQQYAAANGTTPMQYQGGTAPAGAAPVAGDPSQGVPVPTPRPEMQAQAAAPASIPQQAVASSAMAQQPSAFDRVAGEAMGGNSGAADAARAAYLQGEPANKYQRIAQAMEARGITVPQAAPSPAVQQVAEAQQTGQARGRFQQLMSVVVNPAASPEQRQYAASILEQDRQYQTQQQTREWEMLKLREGRAYEESKAARDRAAGNEDYATRKKIDLQFQKPEGVDWQELPNGDYGYFDPATRRFEKLGSAPRADNGGITVSPDGTVQIGGGVKMPANFMPDPENPGAVKPIPGGPGEQLPAELAGRIAIADSFLGQAGPLREQLAGGGATGLWDRFQAGNNSSSGQAGVYRKLQSGADALQRLLTGAGMTESEAAIYAGRYLPTYTDDAASAVSKLDQMTREIQNARAAALRGRGGTGANVTPNGANAPTGGASDYKTKYGLE